MKKMIPVALLTLLGSSCYNRNSTDLYPAAVGASNTCDTTNVTYTATIVPIIKQNCAIAGCHTGPSPANGMSYDTYAGLLTTIQNGQFLLAIRHQGNIPAMPQNTAMLDDCTINKLAHWINVGYPNN